jgi:exopolyphosphatase/guanosine-5'-triphosphate,3'-diphosphate pyrophosphatase
VFGDGRPEVTRSVEIGASGLCERELLHDPPRPEELTNAIGLVQDHLDDVLRDHPAIGNAPTVVGVGGTIEVAASIELGLAEFTPAAVHGFRFDRAAVEDVFRTMATEPLAERVHNPGLPADRAGLIVGGCCVLVAMMRRLQAPALVVSSHGLVDAVASRLLAEPS